jgi:hypothetical protein
MRVLYHPDFPKDIRKFEAEYGRVSPGLAARFREAVDGALDAIKAKPEAAGHFVQIGSRVVRECRRRNLRAFPFFVLYGVAEEQLIIGSLIPSRSDPLTWLARFGAGVSR